MSGVIKGIGKVFKAVGNAIGDVASFIGHHWMAIAAVAATYFTVGSSLGSWGSSGDLSADYGGGGGIFGSGALASESASIGGDAGSSLGADASAFGSDALASESASIGGGFNAGDIATGTTGIMADTAPITPTAAPFSVMAASSGTLGAQGAMSGGFNTMTGNTAGPAVGSLSSNPAPVANAGQLDNVNNSLTNGSIMPAVGGTPSGTSSFGASAESVGQSAPASSSHTFGGAVKGFMSNPGAMTGAEELLGMGLKAAGAYMQAHPSPPANFFGRGPKGGAGIDISTTANGLGLQVGGKTSAPSTVPSALLPANKQPTPAPAPAAAPTPSTAIVPSTPGIAPFTSFAQAAQGTTAPAAPATGNSVRFGA